ncbi:MAG: RecQ family ATP-dependent DNA helicase, partial [Vallitaleaceae bacterium]|nr:RecQ family ATP-dependent DNA helicase [Vallitaleaceae bacterium]
MNPFVILNDVFGLKSFRDGQEEIITHITQKEDVLGIMPTGGGKSLCYQLPALLFHGMTLVVSPLISLMKDQVASLRQIGVEAAFLNSSLSYYEYSEILEDAKEGHYKILYVAPERLLNDDFIDFAKAAEISMITVDEAHCISQWGHSFRTSYLKIPQFINLLPNRPVLTAFTATATEQVKKDIIKQLRLEKPFTKITGFDRKNLHYRVEKPSDKFNSTLAYVKRNSDKSGVIYCSSRKNVEEVCKRLQEQGIKATR